jgi:hypothetical protein
LLLAHVTTDTSYTCLLRQPAYQSTLLQQPPHSGSVSDWKQGDGWAAPEGVFT